MKPKTIILFFSVVFIILGILYAQFYPDGMISYWKFEEGNGSICYDSVFINNGTIHGSAIWTTGKVGGALLFDGVDDFVEVVDNPTLKGMSELTVEAWINSSDVSPVWQGIVVKRNFYTTEYKTFSLHIHRGWEMADPCPSFEVSNGIDWGQLICYETVLSPNQWYHIAGVYDGERIMVFINGDLCGETAFSGGDLSDEEHRFLIGSCAYLGIPYNEGYHFKGKIDEVAVYNRALLPEEIEQHYFNGLNGQGYEQNSISAYIDIDPKTLNKKSKGKWITAYIELPYGYNVDDIDITSVELDYESQKISAERAKIQGSIYVVKFSRQALINSLGSFTGIAELKIIGKVAGIPFEGLDTIRIK